VSDRRGSRLDLMAEFLFQCSGGGQLARSARENSRVTQNNRRTPSRALMQPAIGAALSARQKSKESEKAEVLAPTFDGGRYHLFIKSVRLREGAVLDCTLLLRRARSPSRSFRPLALFLLLCLLVVSVSGPASKLVISSWPV
jgi:hypothetical protein